MRDVTGVRRRHFGAWWARLLAAGLAAAWFGDAFAAIAPWYPRDGEDTCRVVIGAAPTIETPPPPWYIAILRPPGWVGQDPRVYVVPPVLDCRAGGAHTHSNWLCKPTFVPWAKKSCAGLEIRQ